MVEFLDKITQTLDGEAGKTFQRILEKQGFICKIGTKVSGVDTSGKTLKITLEPAKDGDKQVIEADVVLVAIGRVPYTENLGLEAAGVPLGERKRVQVNNYFQNR